MAESSECPGLGKALVGIVNFVHSSGMVRRAVTISTLTVRKMGGGVAEQGLEVSRNLLLLGLNFEGL